MSEFKGIIDDRFELIIKEFQGVLSFGYVLLIVMGMLFESIYYIQFGINIFNYSGILDFLLVPFRRPIVLAILIGMYLFIYLYFFVLYKFLQKRHPQFHRRFYGKFIEKENYSRLKIGWSIVFYIITTIAWAYTTSKNDKEKLYESTADTRIEYDTAGEYFIKGKFIGKNDINIFLLDDSNEVQIIPVNSNIIKIIPLD